MKNKKETKVNDETKKLVLALTEKIEIHKKKQIGENFEEDNGLFKTKVKFNAKSMNKYQYSQLCALFDFMLDNPKLNEAEIRKVLRSKSINFAFLNKCDNDIEGFLEELKKHGPVSMAYEIERQNGGLEKWGKRHL